MRLVNHHEVVVAPVQLRKVDADVGRTMLTPQIGVKEHVIPQVVGADGIVGGIRTVCHPVVMELFGAQDQHVAVSSLEILNHRERREGLAQADGICQDAPVVGLEFVDDGERGVLLEVVEHVPDSAVPEAGGVLGEGVVGRIVEELGEDMVERHVIDEFRRILAVHLFNAVGDGVGDVLHKFGIVPQFVEFAEESLGKASRVLAHAHGTPRAFTGAQLHGGELWERHVAGGFAVVGAREQIAARDVAGCGFEGYVACANPFGAFVCEVLLREFVAKFDLQLRAIQTLLAFQTRDVELAQLLGIFILGEGFRREQEPEFVKSLQLFLELAVCVDGEQ